MDYRPLAPARVAEILAEMRTDPRAPQGLFDAGEVETAVRAAPKAPEALVYEVLDTLDEAEPHLVEILDRLDERLAGARAADEALKVAQSLSEVVDAYCALSSKLHRIRMTLMWARSWREQEQREAREQEFRG